MVFTIFRFPVKSRSINIRAFIRGRRLVLDRGPTHRRRQAPVSPAPFVLEGRCGCATSAHASAGRLSGFGARVAMRMGQKMAIIRPFPYMLNEGLCIPSLAPFLLFYYLVILFRDNSLFCNMFAFPIRSISSGQNIVRVTTVTVIFYNDMDEHTLIQ